ncbi:hypothetical protein AMECASPLE_012863 [Ameca splendens]|uniref:Uncharacterized protein n=1 Tax=Ameca splendens TaxID=208324 RepID=A0ABV0YZZ7_9TELE
MRPGPNRRQEVLITWVSALCFNGEISREEASLIPMAMISMHWLATIGRAMADAPWDAVCQRCGFQPPERTSFETARRPNEVTERHNYFPKKEH